MQIDPLYADYLAAAIMQYDAAGILAGLMPLCDEVHDMLNGINDDGLRHAERALQWGAL